MVADIRADPYFVCDSLLPLLLRNLCHRTMVLDMRADPVRIFMTVRPHPEHILRCHATVPA